MKFSTLVCPTTNNNNNNNIRKKINYGDFLRFINFNSMDFLLNN